MAIVIQFKHQNFSEAKYLEVIKLLQDAGQGNPKGRSYHVCYGNSDEVDIFDIWESMEDFEAFGEILIPILDAMEIKLGVPDIQKTFGIIIGL